MIHIPQHQLKQMRRQYEAGQTVQSLARDYGVSQPTISRRLWQEGAKMRSRGRTLGGRELTGMVERYAAGEGSVALGEAYGVACTTVIIRARKAGVPIRGRGCPKGTTYGSRNPATLEWIAEKRIEGWTFQRIADALGVSKQNIHQILAYHGKNGA